MSLIYKRHHSGGSPGVPLASAVDEIQTSKPIRLPRLEQLVSLTTTGGGAPPEAQTRHAAFKSPIGRREPVACNIARLGRKNGVEASG